MCAVFLYGGLGKGFFKRNVNESQEGICALVARLKCMSGQVGFLYPQMCVSETHISQLHVCVLLCVCVCLRSFLLLLHCFHSLQFFKFNSSCRFGIELKK